MLHDPAEAPAIGTVTLREAARRLSKSPGYVKGAAEALDITLVAVGRALVMSEADYARLARRVGGRRLAAAST